MKVSQFVSGYNVTTKNKDEYIQKHLKNTYMKHLDKLNLANKLVKHTMYDENGKFKINSPIKAMLLELSLVEYYYDLDIDWNNAMDEYDRLCETGLLYDMTSFIPTNEIIKCNSVVDMKINDEIDNTRDLVSYIDSKIEALNIGFDALSEAFDSDRVKSLISKATEE